MRKLALLLLSPTRLLAEALISSDWLKTYRGMSRWNYGFMLAAGLTCVGFALAPMPVGPRGLGPGLALMSYIAFSRVIELILAFSRDALDRSTSRPPRTPLLPRERIWLLVRAYLELVLQFAIIYYAMEVFSVGNAFAPPLQSVWDSVYFSGVTITTTGFGDLVPISTAPRLAALAEAVSGVFFIALSLATYLAIALSSRGTAQSSDEREPS